MGYQGLRKVFGSIRLGQLPDGGVKERCCLIGRFSLHCQHRGIISEPPQNPRGIFIAPTKD
jgi:hypothetical protein